MTKKILPFFLGIIFFIFSPPKTFSNVPLKSADLNEQLTSWQSVIGGEAVAPIAETKYGFAIVSDGRILTACDYSGNIVWQKALDGRPDNILVSRGDFLFLSTRKTKVSMVNPSGNILWTKDFNFTVTEICPESFDGRIFVRGEKEIVCLGTKGTEKWNLKTEKQRNIPLEFFPDGTILLILDKIHEGKSTGLRISPFGEILEEITFASIIEEAETCQSGILLSFSDGSFGLCAIKKDENEEKNQLYDGTQTESRWVLKNIWTHGTVGAFCAVKYPSDKARSENSFFFVQDKNSARAFYFENETGTVLKEFSIGELNLKKIQAKKQTSSGFFICDDRRAIEFTDDGTILWEAFLPQKNSWNEILYTEKNQIVISMKNWILNSYTMSQTLGTGKFQNSKNNMEEKSYFPKAEEIYSSDGILYSPLTTEKLRILKEHFESGNSGMLEKEILPEIKEQLLHYESQFRRVKGKREENSSFYSTNLVFTKSLIETACISETTSFTKEISSLLKSETNAILLSALIEGAGKIAIDEENELLSALELLAAGKTSSNDITRARLICDATYEIVRFMGKESFEKYGKKIITNFLYSRYDRTITEYARLTLKRILESM